MKKVLLLALDLDGTLLNSAHEISPHTKKKLKVFQEHGHLVTIATGRTLQGARCYARELGLTVPIIVNNGALVAETEGHIHNFYPVDTDSGWELLRYCQNRCLPCSFFIGHEVYMLMPCSLAERLHRIYNMTIPKLAENPQEIIRQGVISFVIVLEPEQVEKTCTELQAAFGDRLNVARSTQFSIDIYQPGVSKGKALQTLSQELGVAPQDVIAVGDNHNDLEMLKYAGLGVAMAGADHLVKSVADYVTSGNDNNGIAKLVDKLMDTHAS